MRVKIEVKGRAPRKNGAQSLWNSDESPRVLDLRLAVHKAQKEAGISAPFEGHVRIVLEVYAQNITDRKSSHTYVGDVDTFVAGICESIQPASSNLPETSSVFDGHDEVRPNIPLAINDDAQVTEISAKKIESNEERYAVTIETVD